MKVIIQPVTILYEKEKIVSLCLARFICLSLFSEEKHNFQQILILYK